MKSLIKKLLFLPMRLASAYATLLGLLKPDWTDAWSDEFLARVQSTRMKVVHRGPRGNVDMSFLTPNAVCRFRARTFSTKEPETLEWIDRFGGDGAFYDIGANVGLYSVYYAKSHSGMVYAFEPSTLNLGVLSRNIDANQLSDQVVIVPSPLTSSNQIAAFSMSEIVEGEAMSTFGESYGHDGKPLATAMSYRTLGYALDFLVDCGELPEFPRILKIDVDGIEHLILRGAQKVLRAETLISVLVEVNSEFRDLSDSVAHELESAGFTLEVSKHSGMFESGEFSTSFNQVWVRNSA